MEIIFALGSVVFCTIIFGVGYAILIYHRPFPPGWTWLSVVVGVAFTGILEIIAILITLISLDLARYWWIASYPLIAYILTGLPMITGQEIKRRQQHKTNTSLEQNDEL